ncbi:MAG: hypothetical protein ABWZ19_03985 [Hyphomicrobium sp.]
MANLDGIAVRDPLDLIADIYNSAVNPDRWPTLLRDTAILIKGSAAAIVAQTPGDNCLRIHASWNIGPTLEQAMIASAPLSPAVPAIWLLGIEDPIIASVFYGDDAFANSLWYRRALEPEGFNDVAMIPLTQSVRSFAALMILRSASECPFQPEDSEALALLSPHFRHASALATSAKFMALAQGRNSDDPETPSVGVILTDAAGTILHTNTSAATMLDGCPLLCVDDGLAARDTRSNAALRSAIRAAANARKKLPLPAPASLIVRGPGSRALALWIMPLDRYRRQSLGGPAAAQVAILVCAIGALERYSADVCDGSEAATVAERRLLTLLVRGLTLEKAALALSMPTLLAKAHLARLYVKTQTRNELELVAAVKKVPPLVSA